MTAGKPIISVEGTRVDWNVSSAGARPTMIKNALLLADQRCLDGSFQIHAGAVCHAEEREE